MSDVVVTSVGKRGRVWECKLCPFKGERHYVLRHLYSKHLTFDEWPCVCPVCQYRHYDFRKHPQWYSLHASFQTSVPTCSMPTSADITEESKVAFQMMVQYSVMESANHWEQQRRRRNMAPLPQRQMATSVLRPILPAPSSASLPALSSSGVPPMNDVPPAEPVTCIAIPSYSSSTLPVSSKPNSDSLSSSVSLQSEDVKVLSELLVFEDTSEFDTEPTLKDKSTNTSPVKDPDSIIKRLQEIIRSQERTLRNNTSVILNLQKLLQQRMADDRSTQSVHRGPGEGERPKLTSRRKSPPPPAVKSIVFKPNRQRPRPRSPRASPLDDLFQPDSKKYRKY